MRRCALILAILILPACGRDRYLPAGSLAAPEIRFELAIFFLPSSPPARLPAVDGKRVVARIVENVRDDYPPPDASSLRYAGRGLSSSQIAALQNSRQALVLEFAHSQANVWRGLRNATELVEEIARARGGLIFDAETREVFTPDEWHRRRLVQWNETIPAAADHTTIHVYQDGEFVRAITLGMKKLGLPDIVIDDFTWSEQKKVQTGIRHQLYE